MDWEKQTLEFYHLNNDAFIAGSLSVDMSPARNRFTALLPPNALILDFGCGLGRDTKAFLDAGFRVEAADGSEELAAKAAEYTGIQVKHMLFQDLDVENRYDGIWACASILHLPKAELGKVLRRIEKALIPNGTLYKRLIRSVDDETGKVLQRSCLYHEVW